MIRGFSIMEILIALAILSTTLVATMLVLGSVPHMLISAEMHSGATVVTSSLFSREIARGSAGFGLTVPIDPHAAGPYLTSLSVSESADGSAKWLVSDASWTSHDGASRSSSVRGLVTDHANADSYACSPLVHGDWYSGSMTMETNETPELPRISDMAATRSQVILSSDSSTIGGPSLFLFEWNEDASSLALEAAHIRAATSTIGYAAIAAAGQHIFALSAHATCTAADRCASLETFSTDGALISSLSMPASRSIVYRHGRVFIGALTYPGPELIIIDVSDPKSPVQIGSAEIGANVNDILVIGSIAYVATADNSRRGDKAIMAFDLTNPSESMLPTGSAWQGGGARTQALGYADGHLILGRSFFNAKELYVVDADDLHLPVAGFDFPSGVSAVSVRGPLAYLLTLTSLELLNVSGSPIALYQSIPLPSGHESAGMACSGNRMLLATNEGDSGFLMTVSSP